MTRIFGLFLFIFSTFIWFSLSTEAKEHTIEEFYLELGYKSLEESISDIESHYSQELELPLRLPPLSFTHYFGRFSDLDGEFNDSLEVEFINERIPENHFKIDVRPKKYRITFKESHKYRELKLKDGTNAKYLTIASSNLLIFEKGYWQYIIGVDKRVSKNVPLKSLVQIANTIPSTRKN